MKTQDEDCCRQKKKKEKQETLKALLKTVLKEKPRKQRMQKPDICKN